MPTPCKYCGAPIFFATSRTSLKSMPIDARPVALADGNIHLDTLGRTRYAIVGKRGSGNYVSHFATCPNAPDARIASTSAAGPPHVQRPGPAPGPGAAAAEEAPKQQQLTIEDLD